MKLILSIILLFIVVILAVLVCSGVVVLAAYGLGWLLDLILPFSLFETTLLSLAALGLVGLAAVRILTSKVSVPDSDKDDDDEWDDDDDEEFWDDFDEDEEEKPVVINRPGVPRWRQPIKPVDFSATRPDDRCPCGSGRKYKNCHGAKTAPKG